MENKKHIIFICIIILNLFDNISAQNYSSEELADIKEAEDLLNNSTEADTNYFFAKKTLGEIKGFFRVGYWDTIQLESKKVLLKDLSIREKNLILFYQSGALNNLGYVYKSHGNYKKALTAYLKAIETIKKIETTDTELSILSQRDYAQTINNIAVIYVNQGEIDQGIAYYEKAMKIQIQLNDEEGTALILNNLGYVASKKGDLKKSLSYYFESLKIREKINDYSGIAQVSGNISTQYSKLGEKDESLKFSYKSLENWKKANRLDGIADVYNNLGTYFLSKNNLDSASYYYLKGLSIRDSLNLKEDIAGSLYNLGYLEKTKKNNNQALNYYYQSLNIYKDLDYKIKISNCYEAITEIYFILKNKVRAKETADIALVLAKELGFPEQLSIAYKSQYKIYKDEMLYKKALVMHELYILMRDSAYNENNKKLIVQQQAKYEYEKQKTIDDAENEKLIAIEQQEKEKQKVITYSIGCGLGLVVVFLIFIFNRLQITKKQKIVIEEQKEVVEIAHHELEEKSQEILDSIIYAKRIQNAILPPLKIVKEYLQESFILYKPKDIVAGDFYWLESVAPTSNKKENTVLFAAADCTGHGVPGAMISVVCNNALNRSVREYGLTDPGEILNKTREIVIQEFEKSDENVQDGMDIALCALKGNTLEYAGAHNPLWIVRHSELVSESDKKILNQVQHDAYTLLETKANKQPIGKYDKLEPYTTHTFELQKGDAIYIFSDGFVDQFGGEKGKKFKAKAFREILLSIQNKTMDEQKQIIDTTFENWKGDLEQIDDVCVIGVRI